ncbi:hypothetical protein CHLRE_03g200207v5 [Chlamydomonas reinhardtii]|uniref:Uncharacterized protein n=1 Tax=Chlamydomonas reinhardtii TaxID=3055 RepID=A0A2K3DZK6_CHLRE|nr:uncharacterized protein CHLRE_03g200207v5 [Chlamydomonas reinhardtii]PNW85963.1 hypothetical protein CHLRE_03g200207v5 [Chlamydomonas reinhardtii]
MLTFYCRRCVSARVHSQVHSRATSIHRLHPRHTKIAVVIKCSGQGASSHEQPSSPHGSETTRSTPPPLSSRHYLNISNDSLGPAAAAASASVPVVSPAAVRAQRHSALAQTLVQFVARLPPASPGSAAEALRSRLGARLSAPALGEWIRDFTEALAANATRQAPTLAEEPQITLATADSPDGPVWDPQEQEQLQAELEGAVERLLASQPQLLAQDSAVLVARLRGLAGLLQLQLLRRPPGGSGPGGGGGPTALDLALQRPALLLADLPTLERRLAALQAALGLPDRAAAVAAAVQQPVWLYMEPPPPPV